MKTIDELLEEISVLSPGMWENEVSHILEDWYVVVNSKGVIAYFGNESDALRFRLNYINTLLNPIS